MDEAELRSLINWHLEYRPAWDHDPGRYLEAGVVDWGKSRRLGMISVANLKAYLGVQHIDPSKPGWGFVAGPEARFFVSIFVSGQVITLRTFPTLNAALEMLLTAVNTRS